MSLLKKEYFPKQYYKFEGDCSPIFLKWLNYRLCETSAGHQSAKPPFATGLTAALSLNNFNTKYQFYFGRQVGGHDLVLAQYCSPPPPPPPTGRAF